MRRAEYIAWPGDNSEPIEPINTRLVTMAGRSTTLPQPRIGMRELIYWYRTGVINRRTFVYWWGRYVHE